MKILEIFCSLSIIACVVQSAPRGPKRSKELTDKNFEHDTQATTGSTTGDWFVKFCTKKSKDCKSIEPMWDELAENLFGRVSVAHLDIDKSTLIRDRFNLKNLEQPKLWLFKRRRFYQYDGSIDDIQAMHDFAIDSYDKAAIQGDIPQEAGALSSLWGKLLSTIEFAGKEVNKYVIKDEKTGEVNYSGLAVIYGIPIFVMFSICLVTLGAKNNSGVVGAKDQEKKKK